MFKHADPKIALTTTPVSLSALIPDTHDQDNGVDVYVESGNVYYGGPGVTAALGIPIPVGQGHSWDHGPQEGPFIVSDGAGAVVRAVGRGK